MHPADDLKLHVLIGPKVVVFFTVQTEHFLANPDHVLMFADNSSFNKII